MFFKQFSSNPGDLVMLTGDWEIKSVFRRLLNNPGELTYMCSEGIFLIYILYSQNPGEFTLKCKALLVS